MLRSRATAVAVAVVIGLGVAACAASLGAGRHSSHGPAPQAVSWLQAAPPPPRWDVARSTAGAPALERRDGRRSPPCARAPAGRPVGARRVEFRAVMRAASKT